MGENLDKDKKKYVKPDLKDLRQNLTDLEFQVTQNNATEKPFENPYWDHFERGIYVDKVTGEPLFTSKEKFDSSCGWPSFTKPVYKESIKYVEDKTLFMQRIEVRSQAGDNHLGHVFNDGPEEMGGLRYCINSASIRFIPYDKLDEEGYGEYKDRV